MLIDLLQTAAAVPFANGTGLQVKYLLNTGGIFTLFFIMLGPIKVLGPYAQATAGLEPADAKKFAMRVTLLATLSVVLGGVLGAAVLGKWHISIEVLELTAGLIFMLVALQAVMQQYAPAREVAAHLGPPLPVNLVFPVVVTPYGIAAVILLLSISTGNSRTMLVLGVLLMVMLLNFLAMFFAQQIMRRFSLPLRILGAVLGVLQVALAVQIMCIALEAMGVL